MPDVRAAHLKQSSAQRSKQKHEFITVDNLPPKNVVQYCITGLYESKSGLEPLLCPIARGDAYGMIEKVYRHTGHAAAPSTDTASDINPGPSKHQPRSELCQVLLLAALGSQFVDDWIGEDSEAALFKSGQWYLDVAFGRDACALHRIQANVLAGLYLMLAKNIAAKTYFSLLTLLICMRSLSCFALAVLST